MCGFDLARVEKGEVIPDSAAPKSDFLFLNYNWTLSTNSGTELQRHEKLEQADWFRHPVLEWSFPRNKSKIKRKSTTEILPS